MQGQELASQREAHLEEVAGSLEGGEAGEARHPHLPIDFLKRRRGPGRPGV
jgi:hypothetical protein